MTNLKTLTPRGISVVVPVFNGSNSLPELVDRITKTLSAYGEPFEIILVNDASADDSWKVIGELAGRHAEIVGLDLARNYGQQNALLAGTTEAAFDKVITLDDDLAHPPEAIPPLLHKLSEGFDLVLARGPTRKFASRLAHRWFTRISQSGVPASPFRAFKTSLREVFARRQSPRLSFDVLLNWSTLRITSIPVEFSTSRRRRSQNRLAKRFSLFWDATAGMSLAPLRIATLFGLILVALGAIALATAIFGSFHGDGRFPQLWILAGIGLICGVQSITLGIIGEYLGRVHFTSLGLPINVIREKVGRA